jgi:hypothetical protein
MILCVFFCVMIFVCNLISLDGVIDGRSFGANVAQPGYGAPMPYGLFNNLAHCYDEFMFIYQILFFFFFKHFKDTVGMFCFFVISSHCQFVCFVLVVCFWCDEEQANFNQIESFIFDSHQINCA